MRIVDFDSTSEVVNISTSFSGNFLRVVFAFQCELNVVKRHEKKRKKVSQYFLASLSLLGIEGSVKVEEVRFHG
jgi:hypothetical protein